MLRDVHSPTMAYHKAASHCCVLSIGRDAIAGSPSAAMSHSLKGRRIRPSRAARISNIDIVVPSI